MKFRNFEALILIMSTRQCILSSTLRGRYTRCLDSRLTKIIYTDYKHKLYFFYTTLALLTALVGERLLPNYDLLTGYCLVPVRFLSQ